LFFTETNKNKYMYSDDKKLTDKEAAQIAKFFCWVLLIAFLFMAYHYVKQCRRADNLEAEKLEGDAGYQKNLKMFCSKMNDTLDQYYLVNKNDLELQAVVHIDTNSFDTITLKK